MECSFMEYKIRSEILFLSKKEARPCATIVRRRFVPESHSHLFQTYVDEKRNR